MWNDPNALKRQLCIPLLDLHTELIEIGALMDWKLKLAVEDGTIRHPLHLGNCVRSYH